MRAILPDRADLDPALHARLGEIIDPERKVLAALERIVPLAGKRIADVGTGIGHYPMLLARHTGRTYGIESDPALLDVARQRASDAHQPNLRIVEGGLGSLPLRDEAVDIVLCGLIEPDDASLPAIAELQRVLRPGGRLVVVGYYGRDQVASLLAPEVVANALAATQRRTGWWLQHGFKIKVVHSRIDISDGATAMELLPRLYGDRARAFLMAPHPVSLTLKLGLYHLVKR
ncbi:MAG: methyltransferase domain-containing protein [Chloroflexota bacterium]|nr:methyltransferase domain-containing protein [Chloroflexota bacterium]